MSDLLELRQQILGKRSVTNQVRTRPDLYNFLGSTREAQAAALARLTIPDATHDADRLRRERHKLFQYIVDFLRHSTFEAAVNAPIGKGVNLARHPYLAPTGLVKESLRPDGTMIAAAELADVARMGDFRFQEQYRWDTYFQNKLLFFIGAEQQAVHQLMNFVHVFDTYGRIPNGLTSEFLSHPQPPLEALAARDLLTVRDQPGVTPSDWYDRVMQMVEKDLVTEWWDYGSGRIHPRQDQAFVDAFGTYLTRYVSIHYHPLLVGCQDGKDHHWVTAHYGEHYLPVQLNALVWANVDALATYYAQAQPDRAEVYADIRAQLRHQIDEWLWVEPDKFADAPLDTGRYRGFRNYAIRERQPIAYGDLAAEIFPLFVGLATPEQARITMQNLKDYYEGDIGLATTSLKLREGGSIPSAPPGWSAGDSTAGSEFQWEVNAWPPLMMVAVDGLLNYGDADNPNAFDTYATALQQKWVRWLERSFQTDPTFHEKAPYDSHMDVGAGYYGNLPGFGWTIASYIIFLNRLATNSAIDW